MRMSLSSRRMPLSLKMHVDHFRLTLFPLRIILFVRAMRGLPLAAAVQRPSGGNLPVDSLETVARRGALCVN